MAQHNPSEPYRADWRSRDLRSPSRLDSDLQADPELREGPLSASRIVAFAVAIVLVFAAVFYGMNASSLDPKAPAVSITDSPNQPVGRTAQNQAMQNAPPVAPGVRDVTPRNNTEPATTTGAAPSRSNVQE